MKHENIFALSILSDKVNALDNVPDEWVKAIMNFQPKMLNELNRLLSRITTTSDGLIELTADNLDRVSIIIDELRQYMTTGEYVDIVQDLNRQFMAQQANTIAYFNAEFGEAPVTSFASTLYNTKRAQLLDAVIGDGLNPQLFTPLREALIDGIGTGSSYSEMLENIRTISIGNDELEGSLLRYSRLIVSDTLATTDRQFTQLVGDELGLEWYRYLGGTMKTTRCFCQERNRGYFHIEEIRSWGRGENLGNCNEGGRWQGMRRGTNADTIVVYLGGYNCQHSLIPVSEASVPRERLLEAIQKGYYEPSDFVKQELNL